MNCPKDGAEMDREDLVSVEGGVIDRRPAKDVFLGAEYFCPTCHRSWLWQRGSLEEVGTNYADQARDVIESYAMGYADENGQVW